MEWHAVQTKPGAEGRVLVGIMGARLTGYLPTTLHRRVVRGYDIGIGWKPLFRGYLFAQLDLGRDLPRLLKTDGVECLVRGAGGAPSPIAEDVIRAIKAAEHAGVFDHGATLRAGDHVVLKGPWDGIVAKIRSAHRRGRRSGVRVELTGLPFKVTVPASMLEKVAGAGVGHP